MASGFNKMLKNVLFALYSVLIFTMTACSTEPLLSNGGHIIPRDNKVMTWKDLQSMNVVMQQYDYSCGAASLATLMKYYFKDQDVSEISLLQEIEQLFSPQEMAVIQDQGLSFLELETIVRSKGYQSASVRLKLAALRELPGPVLVYVEPQGYPHFAILRGVVGDRVFLADPSRGNLVMSIAMFLKEWQGETFIMGKAGFGIPLEHSLTIYHQPGFRQELHTLREVWKTRPNWKAL